MNANYHNLVSITNLRDILIEYILPVPSSAFDTAHTLPVAEDLIVDRIDCWRYAFQCYLVSAAPYGCGRRTGFVAAAAALAVVAVGVAGVVAAGIVSVHPTQPGYLMRNVHG